MQMHISAIHQKNRDNLSDTCHLQDRKYDIGMLAAKCV